MSNQRVANVENLIFALRKYGNIMDLSDYGQEWQQLMEKALQLDSKDKTGDSIAEFCQALADLLEKVLELGRFARRSLVD